MSGVTWEVVHSGRQEYRTTQTNLISGTKLGCAILEQGASAYQIPRWEPLNGWREPVRMTRLPAYGQEGTTGAWSWNNSFRHTGSVSEGQTQYYLGPGVARGSDGRIHIRLQPQHSSVSNGITYDYIPNKNPTNNTIYLWAEDRRLFSSISNGLTVEGLFIRGYDYIYRNVGRNNVTLKRNVMWGGHFQTVQLISAVIAPTSSPNIMSMLAA